MLLTKEKFEERLRSEDNLLNLSPSEAPIPDESSVKIVKWGGHSTVERKHYKLDDEQRAEIGSLGRIFPTKDVANLTGVSVDCVRDLRNGKQGSSGYSESLMKEIEDRTEQHRKATYDTAMDKLLTSLGFITSDKMENANAKDLSGIAANLSKVANNLTPNLNKEVNGQNIKVILFQPKPMEEKHFEVIEISVGS